MDNITSSDLLDNISEWRFGNHDSGTNERILMFASCVLLSITVIVGVIGNTLVCISVYTNRSLRTPNNALLVNLAIADLITCIFSVPVLLLVFITHLMSHDCQSARKYLCTGQMFFHMTSSAVQLFTLAFISMERYQAISRPFKSKEQRLRVIVSFLVSWIAGTLLGLMTTLFLRHTPMFLFCICTKERTIPSFDIVNVCVLAPLGLICLGVVLFFYGKIFYIVRKHVRDKGSLFNKTGTEVTKAETNTISRRLRLPQLPNWFQGRTNKVQDISQVVPNTGGAQTDAKSSHIQTMYHGETSNSNGITTKLSSEKQNSLQVKSVTSLDNTERIHTEEASLNENQVEEKGGAQQANFEKSNLKSVVSKKETTEENQDDGTNKLPRTGETSVKIGHQTSKNDNGQNVHDLPHQDIEQLEQNLAHSVEPGAQNLALPNIETIESNQASLHQSDSATSARTHAQKKEEANPKPMEVDPNFLQLKSLAANATNSTTFPVVESGSNASNVVPVNVNEIHGSVCVFNPKSKKTKERGRRNLEAKTAKRASYIIGVFTMCWLPLFLVTFINIFIYIAIEVEALISSIAILSAALNPIAYTVVNQTFRKEFINNVRVITTIPRLCRTSYNN